MPIIRDYETFHEVVGTLSDIEPDELGIRPDCKLGFFRNYRLQELLNYCAKFPQYHIISNICVAGTFVNAPIPQARLYMLAEGNSDPKLYFAPKFSQKLLEDSNVFKFNHSKSDT